MDNEVTVYDFAAPIYRVLLEPNKLFGIGLGAAMAILVLSVVLKSMISAWCGLFGLALFIIAKIVTKKDVDFLNILFSRLMIPSVFRGI